ncbi:MAG: hypothetical protein RL141_825 [Candidatus Parcubacteria bacterium]|jgi:predicted enzyme related to lactoylglutathione lyase
MDHVVHFEIPADNEDRAQAFYEKTFGWSIFKSPIPNWDYRLANTVETDEKGWPKSLGVINGAIAPRKAPEDKPMVVIKVDLLEDALTRITAGGGEITMQPTPVGEIGIYAKFKDTEGNILGVWQDLKKPADPSATAA